MHGEEYNPWWGQAVEAGLGHSFRWERRALHHQRTGILAALPVSTLLAAVLLLLRFLFITVGAALDATLGLQQDLSIFLVLHFEAEAPCKPYTLMILTSLLC